MSDQYYFMSLEPSNRRAACLPVCVIYARPHIPVIPDFPSDIPAVYWNFVYLVSHCVWDLLSTCETQSVPVRGKQPAVTSQIVSQNYVRGIFGELGFDIRELIFPSSKNND